MQPSIIFYKFRTYRFYKKIKINNKLQKIDYSIFKISFLLILTFDIMHLFHKCKLVKLILKDKYIRKESK